MNKINKANQENHMNTPLSILFLCTGNSCRSIMAEALLNYYGNLSRSGQFSAYSAGSFPTGEVHPQSLLTLQSKGIATAGYRSKSWDELANTHIDIVITVCDNAAGESCPLFLGKQIKAHWGVADPAKFIGNKAETTAEFNRICTQLENKIKALVALPITDMSTASLQHELNAISKI